MNLGARGWTRTLWIWWAVLGAFGLGLIGTAFFNMSLYRLKQEEADILPKVQTLREAFAPLRLRQLEIPLALLRDFQRNRLTLDQLNGQRLLATPFFKLYYVDRQAHKVLPDDRGEEAEAWMLDEASVFKGPLRGLAPMRPAPGVPRRPGSPESFLCWIAKNNQGHYLIAETDLDYIFGPWLKEQVASLKLGPGATVQVLSAEQTWKEAKTKGESWVAIGQSRILKSKAVSSAWRFRVDTFFPDDPDPFQAVRLQYESYPALEGVFRLYGWVLGGYVLVMLSFALSIFFAGRTIRRELALADARSNFTAMVSHELKTPVAAIRMYGEILVNKLVDDPVKVDEYHGIILGESARLQRLIENLLDLGKIERGARTYELGPRDVNALVEEAIAQAQGATPQPIACELAPDLPPIQADADAARQAIANLVSNALKYGGKPPEVSLATRRDGQAVLVEVADRGPGIPEARRKAIFEPYVRLEDEARRETQGTGLGLALVKGYMEGQGGSVGVTARPGGGSVFTLRFVPAATDMTKK